MVPETVFNAVSALLNIARGVASELSALDISDGIILKRSRATDRMEMPPSYPMIDVYAIPSPGKVSISTSFRRRNIHTVHLPDQWVLHASGHGRAVLKGVQEDDLL